MLKYTKSKKHNIFQIFNKLPLAFDMSYNFPSALDQFLQVLRSLMAKKHRSQSEIVNFRILISEIFIIRICRFQVGEDTIDLGHFFAGFLSTLGILTQIDISCVHFTYFCQKRRRDERLRTFLRDFQSGGSRYATRAFATPIFVASATPIFVASATPFFRISATQTAATPKILF